MLFLLLDYLQRLAAPTVGDLQQPHPGRLRQHVEHLYPVWNCKRIGIMVY